MQNRRYKLRYKRAYIATYIFCFIRRLAETTVAKRRECAWLKSVTILLSQNIANSDERAYFQAN